MYLLVEFDKEIKHSEVTLIAVFSLRSKNFICPDILREPLRIVSELLSKEKHRITAKGMSSFT